ncbi:MAG: hypothetical protein GY756_00060, partial [bacterium]|nr:hypothetical protein [bacterium]
MKKIVLLLAIISILSGCNIINNEEYRHIPEGYISTKDKDMIAIGSGYYKDENT